MPGLPATQIGQAGPSISHQAAIFHLRVPAQDTAPVKLLLATISLAAVTVFEEIIRNVVVILHRAPSHTPKNRTIPAASLPLNVTSPAGQSQTTPHPVNHRAHHAVLQGVAGWRRPGAGEDAGDG